jgi:tetratricopeptide (TPR) repeat protein
MKKNRLHSLFLVLIIILICSCAGAPKKVEMEKPEGIKPSPVEIKKVPAHTEEETKSLEVFTSVLELIESTDDRKSVLPKIEELYDNIIRQYPEAPLAQESYWKLITIYVDDYSPPAYDKAEMKYNEFLKKYPQSHIKGFIEDTLANSYYKNSDWNGLLQLTTPAYQEYLEKGQQPRASMVFMYAEANYNLGNLEEARKVYKIVSELFPKLMVGINSKKMLEKIGTNQN